MVHESEGIWHYARALAPVGFRTFDNVRVDDCFGSGLVVDLLFGQAWAQNIEKLLFDLPTELLSVQYVVLRGVPAEHSGFQGRLLAELIEQRTGSCTWVGWVRVGEFSVAVESDMPFPGKGKPDDLLRVVRQAELDAQITWSGALIVPRDRHFELPSGTHANGFVRLGDILFDITYVERLADWFEPELMNSSVLAADTWTLLPLLQELRERRSRRRLSRAIIHTFRGYPSPADFDELVAAASAEFASDLDARLLFVLSVRSSSALLENLRRSVESRIGSERVVIRTLVDTGVPPASAFTRVDHIQRYDVPSGQECVLCREPRSRLLVHIDTRKYIAEVPRSDKKAMIDYRAASEHSFLWNAANRTNAVRLHWEDSVTQRHHVVGLDVGKLLEDEEFRRKAVAELRKCVPLADVVVVPDHDARDALIRLAQTAYHEPVILALPVVGTGSEGNEDEHRKRLASAFSKVVAGIEVQVLILDDVLIQGRRIRSFHRLVQHAFMDEVHRTYKICAFAVVARPATWRRWQRLEASLRQGEQGLELGHAELVFLPDVASPRCPWCDEARELKKVAAAIADRAEAVREVRLTEDQLEQVVRTVRRRLEMLERTAEQRQLPDPVFFCDTHGHVDSDDEDQITRNSLFGDRLGPAVAFAAVAATMQGIRNKWADAPAGTTHEWDVAKILAAYHDPLLSAAFLRAAYPEEMGISGSSKDFEDAIDEISFAAGSPELRQSPMLGMELEWALLRGVLPAELRQRIQRRTARILERDRDLMNLVRALRAVLVPASGAPSEYSETSEKL